MTHDEGAVAHVDDVSEETTVDVLDDRTHAHLVDDSEDKSNNDDDYNNII